MERRLANRMVVIGVISAIIYVLLGYFTPRHLFGQLLLLYGLAFLLYLWLVKQDLSLKAGVSFALLFRGIFLLAYPRLSDDYFRFIWDGTLFTHGENPFLHLPSYYANSSFNVAGLTPLLYQNLNSPNYFTVYPPICQFIFALANLVCGSNFWLNCLIMRLFILGAEAGTLALLVKLLPKLNLPPKNIWLYAFNPLIIIELTGNLHFEALLIFFLTLSLYLLWQNRIYWAAFVFGLAVAVKLWPLMFLPFLLRQLNFKAFSIFCLIVGFTLTVLFAPFLSLALFQNMLASVNLYFQKFEFNAGIYYILRWLGYQLSGYNQIAFIGRFLSLITLAGILWLAFRQKHIIARQLPELFLGALTLYLLLATIVHPWYVTPLIALSVLTKWRFPVAWSGVVILSYNAYQTQFYKENLYLVTLEYLVLFTVLAYEFYQQKGILPQKAVSE